jgi:hypothetical protein
VVGPRAPRRLLRVAPPLAPDPAGWRSVVERTALECGEPEPAESESHEASVRLALLRLGPEPAPEPLDPTSDAEEAARRELLLRRWAARGRSGWSLTSRGERAAATLVRTGAVRESDTHRALLLEAARILAHKGHLLDLPRQGGFERPVPDGLLRQIPRESTARPAELARALDEARQGWAWRAFAGRDLHVEAEVSGALRPERIRHGLLKARRQGAYVLFLVPDAPRARRVRAVLARAGAGREEATVWTLRVGGGPPER